MKKKMIKPGTLCHFSNKATGFGPRPHNTPFRISPKEFLLYLETEEASERHPKYWHSFLNQDGIIVDVGSYVSLKTWINQGVVKIKNTR